MAKHFQQRQKLRARARSNAVHAVDEVLSGLAEQAHAGQDERDVLDLPQLDHASFVSGDLAVRGCLALRIRHRVIEPCCGRLAVQLVPVGGEAAVRCFGSVADVVEQAFELVGVVRAAAVLIDPCRTGLGERADASNFADQARELVVVIAGDLQRIGNEAARIR